MAAVLLLHVLSACSDAHVITGDAAASHDGAPRDVAPRTDAGCTPTRQVTTSCHARWARGIALDGGTRLQLHDGQLAPDGTFVVRVGVDAPLTFSGETIAGTGAIALDADGIAAWATADCAAGPALAGGDVWIARAAHGVEALDATTGAHVAALAAPFDVDAITTAGCDACTPSLLLGGNWLGGVDLGPLGAYAADVGTTLVASSSSGALRWGTTVDEPPEPHVAEVELALPRRAMDDGAVVIGWSNFIQPEYGFSLCPVAGGPCADWPDTILVGYGPDGTPRWSAHERAAADIEMLGDGGAVVAASTDLVRYDAAGSVVWRRSLGQFVGPIAVDEARGRVWSALAVPIGGVLEVGGARAGDCPTGASFYSTWPTLLVAFDLATADVRDALLPVDGMEIRTMALRGDGGVVIAGTLVSPGATVTACGIPVAADEMPGQVLFGVIASIDPL